MTIFTTILLGIGVVFLGLVLLCLLIMLMQQIPVWLARRQAADETEEVEEEGMEDAELIAILTAAVAAYSPDKEKKFRVVSFRRRGSTNE